MSLNFPEEEKLDANGNPIVNPDPQPFTGDVSGAQGVTGGSNSSTQRNAAASPTSSGQFQSTAKYMDANKSKLQGLGGKVTGNIEQGQGEAEGAFKSKLGVEQGKMGEGVTKASSFGNVLDKKNFGDVVGMLRGGGYKGPTMADSASNLTGEYSDLQKQGALGAQVGTQAGLGSSLSSMQSGYGPAASRLDAAMLRRNQGSRDALATMAKDSEGWADKTAGRKDGVYKDLVDSLASANAAQGVQNTALGARVHGRQEELQDIIGASAARGQMTEDTGRDSAQAGARASMIEWAKANMTPADFKKYEKEMLTDVSSAVGNTALWNKGTGFSGSNLSEEDRTNIAALTSISGKVGGGYGVSSVDPYQAGGKVVGYDDIVQGLIDGEFKQKYVDAPAEARAKAEAEKVKNAKTVIYRSKVDGAGAPDKATLDRMDYLQDKISYGAIDTAEKEAYKKELDGLNSKYPSDTSFIDSQRDIVAKANASNVRDRLRKLVKDGLARSGV